MEKLPGPATGKDLEVIEEGEAPLIAWYDPDEIREWIANNKSKDLVDKTMDVKEAVAKFVRDGSYIAFGGFGHVRVSMCAVYEIVRQRKRNLTMAAKTAVHDIDVLIAAGCVDKVEVAYAFGHELRGLSPASRRAVEQGRVKVLSEWSNAAFQWRFKAAAMGLPFIPARVMLGSDTLRKSSAKVVRDPFSGKPICLIPACYPDVVFIHVHRADKYGNAQIDGIVVEDLELARAAKRLIVTAEEIVPTERIRSEPWRTTIPYFLVDAVVEQPWGSHPCNMPLLYYHDEEHMAEYLRLTRTDEGTREYFERYVFGVNDFWGYLELVGGARKLAYLKMLEELRAKMVAPWAGG